MAISKLKLLLLLLIPISAASAAGVYYVSTVNAVTPCEALKYSAFGTLVSVQNTWNKPIDIESSTTDAGDLSPIQSVMLRIDGHRLR